jgi:hypothetical protein
MSESLVIAGLLALTTICSAVEPAIERAPISPSHVMVVVYTVPSLSHRVLEQAVQEADEVFDKAGVQIAWTTRRRSARDSDVLDHPVERTFPKPDPACAGFPPEACIIAQVSDRFTDFYISKALGLSRPYVKDPGAVRATVFLNRVSKMAARMGMPVSRLIGAVLAHELGHVLTGTDAHGIGLMRDSWTLEDFHDLCHALPEFQESEIRLMQVHLGPILSQERPQPSDEDLSTITGQP